MIRDQEIRIIHEIETEAEEEVCNHLNAMLSLKRKDIVICHLSIILIMNRRGIRWWWWWWLSPELPQQCLSRPSKSDILCRGSGTRKKVTNSPIASSNRREIVIAIGPYSGSIEHRSVE